MSAWVKDRKKRLLPIALVSLALPVIVCVSAPLELYGNNASELAFSLKDFLPFGLVLWLLAAAAAAAVLFLVPEKLYRVLLPVMAVTAFMMFLQGTYLNTSSFLPGDNMGDVEVSGTAVAVNTAIWILAVALAGGSAFIKKRDAVRLACELLAVVVLGTQIAGMAFVLLTTDQITMTKKAQMEQKYPGYTPRVIVTDNLTTLGSKNNVFVFIIDRFDESFAEGAYYRDMPGVYDELEGFTWFQDNVSLFGHTFPSVAWMLTGTPYSCDMMREDYLNSAYEGETTLKRLHDAGYTINVYTSDYYSFTDAGLLPDYIASSVDNPVYDAVPIRYQFATSTRMAQVGLFRCVPLAMKELELFEEVDSGIDYFYLKGIQPDNAYDLDLKLVYDAVTAKDFTLEGDKMFQFIHVEGCHNVTYDQDWKRATGSEKRNYSLSVLNSFKIIDRCLEQMKSLGVYEDATIIITGDHCSALNDLDPLAGPRVTALFVKPSGVGEGELKISQAQVSHEDLWATIYKSEGLEFWDEYGESVFDVPENETRKRIYRWQTDAASYTDDLDEYVYEINGLAKSFPCWKIVEHNHYDDKTLLD